MTDAERVATRIHKINADRRMRDAAPDMLVALKMAEARLAELNNSPTTLSFVRAAIARSRL